MAQYLTEEDYTTVQTNVLSIVKMRYESLKSVGIDVTQNDTIPNVLISAIVREYDPDFEINLAKNGEDARTKSLVDVELKSTKANRRKRCGTYPLSGFQFHAMGSLRHQAYICGVLDKVTLQVDRIYDIRLPKNVEIIEKELESLSDAWYEKAKITKTSYDVILLKEEFLIQNVQLHMEVINGVKVYRDY